VVPASSGHAERRRPGLRQREADAHTGSTEQALGLTPGEAPAGEDDGAGGEGRGREEADGGDDRGVGAGRLRGCGGLPVCPRRSAAVVADVVGGDVVAWKVTTAG
jgi:hypothetical protein